MGKPLPEVLREGAGSAADRTAGGLTSPLGRSPRRGGTRDLSSERGSRAVGHNLVRVE